MRRSYYNVDGRAILDMLVDSGLSLSTIASLLGTKERTVWKWRTSKNPIQEHHISKMIDLLHRLKK